MDWRLVSPFLAGLSLVIFIPASFAQQTRKLPSLAMKTFIRRARTAQIALSSFVDYTTLTVCQIESIRINLMHAAPTLAKSLRENYTINPSLSPLFTSCVFDGDPAPMISWMLNSTQ